MADLENNLPEEEEEVDVFTLTDEEGNEEQFEILGSIELDGKVYYAMTSVEEKSDEYVILRLEGEDYKRPKAEKTGRTADWYNKKHFSLTRHGDFGGDLFSPELPKILADAYGSMMPMFLFLSNISSRES